MTVEVQPRKPRLVWQGMEYGELVTAVPTQVVEVVRPGRAIEHKDALGSMDIRKALARNSDELPPNRLIWTNDNIVALRTLLDERDDGGAYRYRGKVDLIYIDPPFMVQSDFRADNTVEIELDEGEHIEARKEPSLVEILAYKDTWRQGLDSFLSMLRARLLLLKDLLAPTGSIYVHLDWHAVHYVKVMMDEIFGYENFSAEIIWKRTSARSDANNFNAIHDTILHYSAHRSAYFNPIFAPYSQDYIKSHYGRKDSSGRRYRLNDLRSPNPRPNMMYDWKGYKPHKNGWSVSAEVMQKYDEQGLIYYPPNGERLAFKKYLDDEGSPVLSIWSDIPPVNSQAVERLGYPTQKPVALLERIIRASCPPGGLVLDCFMGSGTTVEAAERLGRRWIGVDNGKFAVHLARKRLIQLHDQPRPPEKPQYSYDECEHCGNIERKEKKQKAAKKFEVQPFSVENMGVYQRVAAWEDFASQRSKYRDEMMAVFGGEVVQLPGKKNLHGKKGNSWVHVGPLDGPVPPALIWTIAREAADTQLSTVTILSADADTLPGPEKKQIAESTGVTVVVRIIPASAIDEVRRRLELQKGGGVQGESMAVPVFYAPLAIVLAAEVKGNEVTVRLERCEVDEESFVQSQRPLLKPISEGMSAGALKKAKAELKKWEEREQALKKWLRSADSWKKFVDFWAVDWDYQSRRGEDGKPIFETDWQSFRTKGSKGTPELTFEAIGRYDRKGRYEIAARVTDVFGNDGIATVVVEVK